MAYNFAALRGGSSIQDAINQIEGGWLEPGFMDDEAATYGDSEGDVEKVRAIMNAKFTFTNPQTLEDAIRTAYSYDSALMAGRPDVYHAISNRLKADPAMKKLVNYIRRVAHRGTSRPQKVTRLQTLQRRAMSEAARKRNQALLRESPWFGSAPYTGVGTKRQPYYKGLYVTGSRKGATPWYSGIGSRVTAQSLFDNWLQEQNTGEPAVKKERV